MDSLADLPDDPETCFRCLNLALIRQRRSGRVASWIPDQTHGWVLAEGETERVSGGEADPCCQRLPVHSSGDMLRDARYPQACFRYNPSWLLLFFHWRHDLTNLETGLFLWHVVCGLFLFFMHKWRCSGWYTVEAVRVSLTSQDISGRAQCNIYSFSEWMLSELIAHKKRTTNYMDVSTKFCWPLDGSVFIYYYFF